MTKFDVWTLRATRALLSGAIALTLAACGGGGGSAGTPVVGPGSGASTPSGGGGTAVAADLVVVLSKSTLSNSGADSITATVTTVDSNRVAVGGVPVSFGIDANAVVTAAGTTTGASTGTVTATITQGSDSTVRPVKLTVTSGSVSRVVTLNVVQDTAPANPQATDLSLTLNASNIDNSGSKTVVATVTAVDVNRNALQGIPVQLSVDSSAVIAVSATQTNAAGQVQGTVGIGSDKSNRTITVTATSGTLVRTAAFEVTGTRFMQASPVPAVVSAGAAGTVQYIVADVNSNPIDKLPITVTGNGITSQTGVTNRNGEYTFNYTAPNAPGTSLTILATAGAETSSVTVTVLGGTTSVPAAKSPVSTALNLSANVVAVNNDKTNNVVAINAFFRDASNAPIPNVRAIFGVTGDNGTGSIGAGANTVLSDASGAASTTYKPGAVSSPTNGVTILACYKTTDFVTTDTAANCAAAGGQLLTTTLTIVSNPVSISIGTDNKIELGTSKLTYVKKYAVLVVDSAGNPKADVQITPSLDLGGFSKGSYAFNKVLGLWVQTLASTCPSEDLNRNGVIDTSEDVNGNLALDPRKSDVSITLVGSTKTDANGVAVLQLEYPQSVASWIKYKITVTAAGVLSPPAYYPLGMPVALPSQSLSSLLSLGGSTPVEDYIYTYDWLPVLVTDAKDETVPPAFVKSPYGTGVGCTNTK